MKSVVVDGVDVTDVPFDFGFTSETHADAQIVLSSAGAAIAGHVTNASAAPVTDYAVIVFGTDRGTWFPNSDRVRLATPRQDGSFEVSGLPPGEYWVAAVDRIDGSNVAGDWQKPEALEQLSFRAQRKTLVEGERFMMILRLIRR
jgi:transcriptional regulator GlxA family with amidase domain